MTALLPVSEITRQLMVRTMTGQTPAMPFARDIFLLETHVAGIAYHQAETVKDELFAGMPLVLRREPANPHDELAIEVFTADNVKLGYVPRVRNPVLARLMDAGKTLTAEVAKVGTWDRWGYEDDAQMDIRLRILLQDH